jgi:serine/threonine protein kinase/tetratricopeptide (TPR) repeat protein
VSDALVSDTLERLRLVLADHYAVERELGRGGMATVFLAQDLRHDRKVAIKVLRPDLSASLGAERFLREIKLAAKLQHPNILGLFDSGAADGLLFYVMPFVDGESLRGKLDREKQLAIPEAIQIVRESADALGHAHGLGIIHRDIKPENILLSGGHVLVADFGIARAVDEAGGQKLTETGMAVGTPYYMSPEQAMGGHVDARSDVYSLGCVLYELLAGQPPFTGPTAMAIIARHSLEAVPSVQVVRQSIPDDVEAIIVAALAKVPADRFRSMQELSDALRDADYSRITPRTAARPVPTREVRTYGGISRTQPLPWWRRRTFTVGASAATLLLLSSLGYLGWRRQEAAGRAATAAAGVELDPRRLAVLYFQNRGGPDSLGFLADGLTEALIHELSQVRDLQVISRNGVAPFKGHSVAPDSLARALKVGTLVDGTVAQSGNRLRVTVSMVNTGTGAEIGSTTLDRPRQELFALEDDVAQAVSVLLRKQLGQEVALQTLRAGTKSTEAWEMVQRGQRSARDSDSLMAASDSAGATRMFATADSQFARAEALDRDWSAPPTLRGWLDYQRTRLSGSFNKAYYSTWLDKGLEHAERALTLSPKDADALELRGTLRYWRWLLNLSPDAREAAKLFADAESDFRASVAANPNQATAWTSLTHLLMAKSATGEAKLAGLRAYEADPYLKTANVTVWRLFQSSLDLEDGVEAKHWCDEGRKRFPPDPRFAECQLWLSILKDQKPDVPHAWKLLEEYQRLSPPNLRAYRKLYGQMILAMGLARAGLADSARAVAVRSRADAELDPAHELAYYEAIVRNLVGDRKEALSLLGTYLATNPQLRESEARDQSWYFRNLKDDPEYKALVGNR